MEIVQTRTATWPWCMGMFGARFAVFVRRARVLPTRCHATRNLSFLRCHQHRHPVVATRNFYWDGTGWCENSTRWKSCKPVQPRGRGAWACLAHGLQCLCDGRACCPARAMQLVICRFLRFHRHRHPVVSTRNFYWDGTGRCENSTRWKSCKPVRTRAHGASACLAHALQCLWTFTGWFELIFLLVTCYMKQLKIFKTTQVRVVPSFFIYTYEYSFLSFSSFRATYCCKSSSLTPT